MGVLPILEDPGGQAMSEVLIDVDKVMVTYLMSHDRAGTLKEFTFQLLRRQVRTERFIAAREVSFQVRRGETLSIIGPNGAGKTTMMKVVARVLPPTEGRVVVRGNLAPMIALGAGFNPELTGYENIVLFGTLLGRSPTWMRARAAPIAEWAGLLDFLDVPIRSYSSGMLARLGFAIASDTNPDVLLVDEVLAVGDEEFQRKSYQRMGEMMGQGAAVLLVSHDLAVVKKLSDRVIWMDHGRVRMEGDPGEVVDAYRATVG